MDAPREQTGHAQWRATAARRRERYFLIFLVLVSLTAAYKVIQPYVHAFIFAALLASMFYPVHVWILRRLRDFNRRRGHSWVMAIPGQGGMSRRVRICCRRQLKQAPSIAALCTCILVALVVIIPLSIFGVSLVHKGIESFRAVHDWVADGKLQEAVESGRVQAILSSPKMQRVIELREKYLPDIDVRELAISDKIVGYTQDLISYLGGRVLPMLNNVFAVLMNFVLMLFTMFYFIRDGDRIMAFILKLCPLSAEHEEALVQRIAVVSKSAILGAVLTAAAQALLAMAAFAAVGIEWFFWGVMLGFASLIPVIGTALVWVPCVIYLFIVGRAAAAVGLLVYCIIVVSTIADNLLRPLLMGGDTGLSSMLLFFSIIGGLQLFGLLGLIYGPLIFGIAAILLYIYDLETRTTTPADDSSAAAATGAP